MFNLPFLKADYSGGGIMGGYGGGYGGWHDGGMMGWWGLHGITSLVLLLLVAAVLVVAVRWLWRASSSTGGTVAASGGRSALSILEQRYAHGEVDRDEFLARKKDLGG